VQNTEKKNSFVKFIEVVTWAVNQLLKLKDVKDLAVVKLKEVNL
jgi:hypothetical protein